MKRPNCPRCGKLMQRGSKAQSGKLRWRCNKIEGGVNTVCYQTTDPSKPVRDRRAFEPTIQFNPKIKSDKIVVTWAQNATPVHEGFFQALLTYCKANSAQLVVIPGRYRNPTSIWSGSQENAQWWAAEVQPYLMNQRCKLTEHLIVLGDIKIHPTAIRPLSGFESITHSESGILGHPKLQMECIPTPHQRMPKILASTGAVTVKNYTDSKAGKKGDFHHVFGAIVVERNGETFHMRHLNARADGAFCDLDRAYFADRVEPSGPYAGLVLGDAHPDVADPVVVNATFGRGGLVERLQPAQLVFHDLFDAYAVNPHHVNNPFMAVHKRSQGLDVVRHEVQNTLLWLKSVTKGRRAVIVPSNHDDMLTRWVKAVDWKLDPTNAHFYLQTALYMIEHTVQKPGRVEIPDPFHYWVGKAQLSNVHCIPLNTSYMIEGIECGLHGHEGPNGARGSRANLSKIGAKTIIGHSHTPGIKEGCYQAGTMTHLQLEYTGPVSSWMNAHVSIDPMGKRHIHICVKGRFWK
jgi:hypothetical protein